MCTAGKPYELNLVGNRRYLRVLGDGKPKKYTISGPENSVPYAWLGVGVPYALSGVGSVFEKGKSTASRTLTIPSAGAWGYIGDCRVSLFSSKEEERSFCSDLGYQPADEQCWTIKVE